MDGYDSSAYTTTSSADAGLALIFMGFYLLFILVVYVVYALLLGMIFKKAGVPAWKAWVPIYNTWVMMELGDQPGWWAVLSLVPFANIVAVIFMYIAMYHIGLKLQKEGWFVLLAIFVPIVWFAWLALDKSTWQGRGVAAESTVPPSSPQPVA